MVLEETVSHHPDFLASIVLQTRDWLPTMSSRFECKIGVGTPKSFHITMACGMTTGRLRVCMPTLRFSSATSTTEINTEMATGDLEGHLIHFSKHPTALKFLMKRSSLPDWFQLFSLFDWASDWTPAIHETNCLAQHLWGKKGYQIVNFLLLDPLASIYLLACFFILHVNFSSPRKSWRLFGPLSPLHFSLGRPSTSSGKPRASMSIYAPPSHPSAAQSLSTLELIAEEQRKREINRPVWEKPINLEHSDIICYNFIGNTKWNKVEFVIKILYLWRENSDYKPILDAVLFEL